MTGTCPDRPTPPPSCGTGPCDDASPFDAATGAAEQGFSFMRTSFGSFDINWYNLYESGGSPADPNRGLGSNWSAYQFAEVTDDGNGNVAVMFAPGRAGTCGCQNSPGSSNTYWFKRVDDDKNLYSPCFGCLAQLTVLPSVPVESAGDWRLVETNGMVTVFDATNGLIKSQTTPGGQVTEFTYTGTPVRVAEMRRTFEYGTNQETIESRLFEYDSDDLQYVTLRRATDSTTLNWDYIRRLELVYYTTNETGKGNDGDLKLIKQQLPGATPGTWVDDKVQLFRYYTSGENDGFQHGLKYVLSPEGYERMSDPEGSSNSTLAPYASAYYEYDSDRLVSKVSTEGGQRTDTIVFSPNPNFSTYSYENWYRKAVITMPDGLVKTVYSNHVGQDLLIDDEDGDDNWITYSKINSDGRLEELVHPSAINSYDDDSNNLGVDIKTGDGLIDVTTYYGENDIAPGYRELMQVRKGSGGTIGNGGQITLTKTEYGEKAIGSDETETTVNPVTKQTVYRSASGGGDDEVDTNFGYTWHDGTVQPKIIETKLPNVPATENGVDFPQTDTTLQEFDIQGRLIESTDARGTVSTYEYDEVTGAATEMVQDSETGGLQLTTNMTNDDLGRQEESLGPEHNINGQTLRTANWTVYQDADDEVWSGRGYKIGSSYTLVNPVSIQKLDKDGRVFSSIQATRGSGVENSGKLSASDTFPRSSWVRWTRTVYGDGGRVTAVRVYHNIPSLGEGNSTANYDETTFDYDSMGRQNMVKTPNGTITRTVFDVRGLTDSVWVGTNDTGATDTDPTGGGAQNNNMEKVVQNEYDGGTDGGDGNLTETTRPVNDTSSNDRITEMEYDWRDRLTTTIFEDGSNDFHNISTLDNLGRATLTEVKRDDTSSLVLIAKNETKFDTRGRTYRTLNYAVSNAGVAGNSLESNTWFDENGNVIKSKPSGSEAFTKTTYDAINRPTNSYYGYFDGTPGNDVPSTLVDNVIFEESETEYDDASNVTFTTAKQRFHNATGTGALNGPGGSPPKSRDSYVLMWYDGIGRNTETANYGTNAGTKPTRPNTAPVTPGTELVSESVYNADGELEDVTDPEDKTDRTEFDDAGRTTKVTMNFGGTDTEVTRTEYDHGQMSKQIAENSTTGNQTTTYSYGVTLTNSNIASNDLLQKVTYPDSGEVVYEYDRQSEQNKMTDQNDTVHVYEYDKLGRRIEDQVTLAGGSAVDGSVLRVETSYDDRLRIEKVTSYDATTGGDEANEVQFEYNDFNQTTKDYQAHGDAVNASTTPKVQYAYESGSSNNNIRQTSMTYPDGRVVNYDYGDGDDADDQLSRILGLKIGSTEIVDYSYLGLNQVVIQKYTEPSTPVEYNLATGTGNDPYDGLDRFGRIVELLWQKGSTKLVDYEYEYDRVGNREKLDVKNSPVIKHVDGLYGYDKLYRLTDYDRGQLVSGSISSPDLTQDWTLDQTGNWANFIQGVTGILNQTRTQNTTNEITNITKSVGAAWPSPTHDDNGNMTSFPQPNSLTDSYDATWDAWNRLIKLEDGSDTVAEFVYDGLGRRIIKKYYKEGSLSETRHFYFSTSSQVLEERIDTDTDPTQQFLWGIRFVDDMVLRDKDTTGNGTLNERLYGLSDPRFSILAITDDTGAVQERYAYDGYGHSDVFTPNFRSRASSSFGWEYRYTGRRLDLETAIYFFRARFYHAELGRFVSRDPIGYVDGLNLYRAYFAPNEVDPNGTLCKKKCTVKSFKVNVKQPSLRRPRGTQSICFCGELTIDAEFNQPCECCEYRQHILVWNTGVRKIVNGVPQPWTWKIRDLGEGKEDCDADGCYGHKPGGEGNSYSAGGCKYHGEDDPGQHGMIDKAFGLPVGQSWEFSIDYRFLVRIIDVCNNDKTVESDIVEIRGQAVVTKQDVIDVVNSD